MFGPDYLVAPIVTSGARSWKVYLPSGNSWKHLFSETVYDGGASYDIDTPLDEFPIFLKM